MKTTNAKDGGPGSGPHPGGGSYAAQAAELDKKRQAADPKAFAAANRPVAMPHPGGGSTLLANRGGRNASYEPDPVPEWKGPKHPPITKPVSAGASQGYNATAVNKAIASSNRSGKRIGGKEASAIHRLLRGGHDGDAAVKAKDSNLLTESRAKFFNAAPGKDAVTHDPKNGQFSAGGGGGSAGSSKGTKAAMAVHKQIYTPNPEAAHVGRSTMAASLREARSIGLKGPGKSKEAAKFATSHNYTGVKGAHFVDQGLGGQSWAKNVPKWAGTQHPNAAKAAAKGNAHQSWGGINATKRAGKDAQPQPTLATAPNASAPAYPGRNLDSEKITAPAAPAAGTANNWPGRTL